MDLSCFDGTKALIFDLDGTLANSMPAHLAAWQKVGKVYGFHYEPEELQKYAGKPGLEIAGIIIRDKGLSATPEEMIDAKEANFLNSLTEVEPIKPIVRLVEKYHKQIPMSVGTGSLRHVADKVLKQIGIHDKIDIVVTADDVTNHKPAPDTFLKCAEAMDTPAENCMVFEDAELGFQAAEKAGMFYIDVRPFYR